MLPGTDAAKSTTFTFASVPLVDVDLQTAVDVLVDAALRGRALGVHLCNAYTLTLAANQPDYREHLVHEQVLNLPDGTPVAWYHRWASGQPARGPVRGPSLMRATLERPGLRHFLLGGRPDVLADLERAVKDDYPNATVVDSIAPPFREPTADDVADYARWINDSGAHIVWIGLGTPRQDALIAALVGQVDAVLVGVGAAFDFLSGHKKEAPKGLHGSGFEWLHRLVSEPKRLWKRYLVGNSRFLALCARELWRARRAS
nr:WecB/TagA/CpsF family glycosyltransferase [Motilibacter deserti]